MTQYEKDILVKDLCARLPYGVKVQVDLQSNTYSPIVCKVGSIECSEIGSTFIGVETSPDTYNEFREFLCKSYLFPLSSMTEEQKNSFPFSYSFLEALIDDCVYFDEDECITLNDMIEVIQWCYKNHFDIHGLIPKGLAIDASGKNIY